MSPEDAIHFPTAADWSAWLEEHHATAPEIWVLTHKKHTGVPSVAWADAVVEALRFGWIDGLVRRVDEDRFVQRWTPRRPTSRWSKINVATAERLIATIRPEVYVKGADYAEKPLPERPVVEAYGGRVVLIGLEAGRSTTGLIARIVDTFGGPGDPCID